MQQGPDKKYVKIVRVIGLEIRSFQNTFVALGGNVCVFYHVLRLNIIVLKLGANYPVRTPLSKKARV